MEKNRIWEQIEVESGSARPASATFPGAYLSAKWADVTVFCLHRSFVKEAFVVNRDLRGKIDLGQPL